MKTGLRTKVFLALIAIVLGGVTLGYLVTNRVQTAMMVEERLYRESHLTQTLSRAVSERSLETIEERESALKGMADGDEIVGIFILSAWGEALSSVEADRLYSLIPPSIVRDLLTADESAQYVAGLEKNEIIVSLAQIPREGEEDVRYLLVISSSHPLDEKMTAADDLVSLFALLVFFLVLAVGYLLLSRIVVRPVRALARATARVHDDVEAAGISLPVGEGGDELARLQHMLKTLRGRMKDVEMRVSTSALEQKSVFRKLQAAEESLVRTEKLASVGVLTAGIAHEIGNPMGVIFGYLDILKEGDVSDEERDTYLEQMGLATQRMDEMIRDLLRFSRANTPGDQEVQSVHLSTALERAIQLVKPQKRFKAVEIHTELLQADIEVECEGSKLEQILVNLLLNAGDAVGNMGDVYILGWQEGPHAFVSVRDGGVGISAENLERIFDPFFTTKHESEGTGLGLAICRKIARDFGGDILVESAVGVGTTFSVKLWVKGWPASSQPSSKP
jgi:signal transduction histidine kinase